MKEASYRYSLKGDVRIAVVNSPYYRLEVVLRFFGGSSGFIAHIQNLPPLFRSIVRACRNLQHQNNCYRLLPLTSYDSVPAGTGHLNKQCQQKRSKQEAVTGVMTVQGSFAILLTDMLVDRRWSENAHYSIHVCRCQALAAELDALQTLITFS